ncbi:MAG: tetratricopeptide repeat protein [Bryobacteraceae bacterium]|jgi:Tfp pilus assembly protein PilF
MATNRLEILRSMVEQNPSDAFSRYGLAMEYVRLGDLLAAVDEFVKLLDHNPNYAAAYFHGAQTLEKLGRIDEAKGLYRRGIEVTSAMGDDHTCGELQAALDLLG